MTWPSMGVLAQSDPSDVDEAVTCPDPRPSTAAAKGDTHKGADTSPGSSSSEGEGPLPASSEGDEEVATEGVAAAVASKLQGREHLESSLLTPELAAVLGCTIHAAKAKIRKLESGVEVIYERNE